MKKLIIFIMVVCGGFFLYNKGIIGGKSGAFDAKGGPRTIVYTFDDCSACKDAMKYLDSRDIEYEEINISRDEKLQKEFFSYPGGGTAPKIISGNKIALGFKKQELLYQLIEAYGMEVLTQQEQDALKTHFDSNGKPLAVMYGNAKCGYCKQARDYFHSKGIDFVDLDINLSEEAHARYTVLEGNGTPVIYFGSRMITGFNPTEIDKAIKELL